MPPLEQATALQGSVVFTQQRSAGRSAQHSLPGLVSGGLGFRSCVRWGGQLHGGPGTPTSWYPHPVSSLPVLYPETQCIQMRSERLGENGSQELGWGDGKEQHRAQSRRVQGACTAETSCAA